MEGSQPRAGEVARALLFCVKASLIFQDTLFAGYTTSCTFTRPRFKSSRCGLVRLLQFLQCYQTILSRRPVHSPVPEDQFSCQDDFDRYALALKQGGPMQRCAACCLFGRPWWHVNQGHQARLTTRTTARQCRRTCITIAS